MTRIKNKRSRCMVADFSTLFFFYCAEFVKDTDSSINTTEATQKSQEIDIYTNRSKIQSKAGGSVIAETLHLKSEVGRSPFPSREIFCLM